MTAALQVPMISIKRVDNLQSVWVDVCNWIDAALDHPAGLLSSRDVYHAVLDGRMDLHVIRGGDAIHAVIVTEFVSGSRGRGLSVVAIGGRHMDEWLADVVIYLERLATANRCKFISEMGRDGWRRALLKLGWVEAPAIMMKVI